MGGSRSDLWAALSAGIDRGWQAGDKWVDGRRGGDQDQESEIRVSMGSGLLAWVGVLCVCVCVSQLGPGADGRMERGDWTGEDGVGEVEGAGGTVCAGRVECLQCRRRGRAQIRWGVVKCCEDRVTGLTAAKRATGRDGS